MPDSPEQATSQILPSRYFFKIDWTKHGAEDNCFVLDRKLREDRQPEISPILVFTGAAYDNIIIAVSPVSWRTFRKAFNALCEKVKHAVIAAFYHFPAFIKPLIFVFKQKIRGKASHDNRAGLDLRRSVTLLFHRQIEVLCFAALFRRNRIAVCFILPINITVTASFGVFRTSVPWVPTCVFLHAHLFVPTLKLYESRFCRDDYIMNYKYSKGRATRFSRRYSFRSRRQMIVPIPLFLSGIPSSTSNSDAILALGIVDILISMG